MFNPKNISFFKKSGVQRYYASTEKTIDLWLNSE